MSKVEVRLVGEPEDVEAVARVLRDHFRVLQEGRDRRNRDEPGVRRYVDVHAAPETTDLKPAEHS